MSITLAGAVAAMFFVPFAAAQGTATPTVTLPPGQPITLELIEYAVSVITDFLLYIAGTVAVFFVVLSGILWTTSGGEPKRLEAAKNMFKAAIIGSVIIFGVGVIVNTIENCLQGGCFFGGGGNPTPGRGYKNPGEFCEYDSECKSGSCSVVIDVLPKGRAVVCK